jgi:hypothetical protein
MGEGVLVIACGALAREIKALKRLNGWPALDAEFLPAELHNRPEMIPAAVRELVDAKRGQYRSIFVAYADCGTGGKLDEALAGTGIERLPGAHCYEFYATSAAFASLAEQEVGTYYLTDYLVRHFDRLVIRGLAIDRHPELKDEYFRHYRRLVYLAQAPTKESRAEAERIARDLGLAYHYLETGYGGLGGSLARAVGTEETGKWQS